MNTLGKILATLLFTGIASMPLSAFAQDESPMSLSGDVMAIETVVDEAGNETTRLVEPKVIVPGDRLVFGTDFANNGDEPIVNFVVTNPLPSAVRLAPDADASLTVSVDDGLSWGILAELTVTAEDGTERAAVHDDVTHVRWTLPTIAPGAGGRLEYPAVIR